MFFNIVYLKRHVKIVDPSRGGIYQMFGITCILHVYHLLAIVRTLNRPEKDKANGVVLELAPSEIGATFG